jgi:predicted DCC family thiol-disulfide oxidoreductase YuxK
VGQPVLLYDGLCGFCDRTVQFILARDPGGPMHFAPLQGEYARQVLKEHPSLRDIDSLILVEAVAEPHTPLVRSDAILAIADYLGWPWRGAAVLRIVPRALRDWAYDRFARHRYRLFGRYDACPIPSPDVRARFID